MFLAVKNKMKLVLMNLILIFSMLFLPSVFATTKIDTQSVVGNWESFYEKSKKPSSIITIYKEGDFFEGAITKTFRDTGRKQTGICESCEGELKNKPILNMVIIRNMQCIQGYCKNGTVLDPTNGKEYHATMRLIDNGLKLKLHGYIGIPLFGRSVVWEREIK